MGGTKSLPILIIILTMCFTLCRGDVHGTELSAVDKAYHVADFLVHNPDSIGAPMYDFAISLVNKMGAQGAQIVLGATAKVLQQPNVQSSANIVLNHIADAYNISGVKSWNSSFLQMHQKDAAGLVFSNLNALETIQDVFRQGSARDIMPLMQGSVRQACYEDSMDVLDALVELYPWARSMFDATGKLPSGILKGDVSMLGGYDECLEIKATVPSGVILGNRTKSHPWYPRSFGTKFCRASMNIDSSAFGNIDTRGVSPIITLGLCMPNSCNKNDVEGLLKLGYLGSLVKMMKAENAKVYCDEERKVGDDDSAIAAICVLSIFGFLVLCGTTYETLKALSTRKKNDYELQKETGDKMYDTIQDAKKSVENDYSSIRSENIGFVNKSFSPDSVVKENGGIAINSNSDLPRGYVPHAEGNTANPRDMEKTDKNGSAPHENSKQSIAINVVPDKRNTARETEREGILEKFFKCFSIKSNAPKIISGKSGAGAITCLHGIRFFSITWIMLGHTYNYGLISVPGVWTTVNYLDAVPMIQRFTYQAVVAGGFSVDTFYMISGFLLVYVQLRQMRKLYKDLSPSKVGYYVFYYYFHRFWRLTPMYMMVVMIFGCLFLYFGDGPMWPEALYSAEKCRINWWTNLLYINNLVLPDEMCMGWSWFLANDMQFYAVSIILLAVLAYNIYLGSVFVFLLMSAGIASAGWKEHIYNGNFFTTKSDGGGYWNNVYITPWCRVAAFCVGMFLGIIFYKNKKIHISRVKALAGWCLAIAMGLALVYGTYSENKKDGEPWSRNFRAAYESLGRPLWAACVAWVIFACHYGAGGIVNSILSWSGLVPLSRLSYAAYLIHPILFMAHVYSKRNLVYLRDYDVIYLFLGHTVMTFMIAFVVSLVFEAPFMGLEKLIIGKRK